MNVAALLAKGRRAYGGLLQDSCRVTRPGGRGPFNEDTGQYDPAPATVVYEGSCVLKAEDVVPQDVEAGERQVSTRRYETGLPFDASEPVRKGDVVEFTAVPSWGDAWLPGRKFSVTAVGLSSLSVVRKLTIEEQT